MGVSSTYFVLLTSVFYNLMSKEIIDALIKTKKDYEHNIRLYFDELNCHESYCQKHRELKKVMLGEA